MSDKLDPNNPFQYMYCGRKVETLVVEDRLHRIRQGEFSADGLRMIINLPNVQKTVKTAAERRLRKLEKQR